MMLFPKRGRLIGSGLYGALLLILVLSPNPMDHLFGGVIQGKLGSITGNPLQEATITFFPIEIKPPPLPSVSLDQASVKEDPGSLSVDVLVDDLFVSPRKENLTGDHNQKTHLSSAQTGSPLKKESGPVADGKKIDDTFNTPSLGEITQHYEKAITDDLAKGLTNYYKSHLSSAQTDSPLKKEPVPTAHLKQNSFPLQTPVSKDGNFNIDITPGIYAILGRGTCHTTVMKTVELKEGQTMMVDLQAVNKPLKVVIEFGPDEFKPDFMDTEYIKNKLAQKLVGIKPEDIDTVLWKMVENPFADPNIPRGFHNDLVLFQVSFKKPTTGLSQTGSPPTCTSDFPPTPRFSTPTQVPKRSFVPAKSEVTDWPWKQESKIPNWGKGGTVTTTPTSPTASITKAPTTTTPPPTDKVPTSPQWKPIPEKADLPIVDERHPENVPERFQDAYFEEWNRLQKMTDSSISEKENFGIRSPIPIDIEFNHARTGQAEPKPVPDDPFYHSKGTWGQKYDDQWALKRIGFTPVNDKDSAWNLSGPDGAPVIVAVIDSGIDFTHPELRGRIWRNEKEIPGNGKDDDGNGYIDDIYGWNFIDENNNVIDLNGHGTFNAGIIAATTNNGLGIAGINPKVKIMPLKALDFDLQGGSIDVSRAIYYAAQNGARVINISIGGKQLSRLEQRAVDYARWNGAVVVVAAGNEGVDTDGFFPAGLNNVITVTSTDIEDKRTNFSNWGQKVDISAPGADILSLRAAGTDTLLLSGQKDYQPRQAAVGADGRYYRATGTSFSAPLVSGVASLLFSKNPKLTGGQVERMILNSGDDIDVPGWDQYTGYGLLNARKALKADPDYYTIAMISKISPAKKDGRIVIELFGRAESSDFDSAWVEVGLGEKPGEWKKVGKKIENEIMEGLLTEIPSDAFVQKGKWSLRLIVKTKTHGTREAWGSLTVN